MPNQEAASLELVFRGLSDPTRLAVVERLGQGPAAVSELAAPFDMALPSFQQHLGVLEACGLVTSQKVGRVRTYYLVPGPLRQVETWLDRQRAHWTRRLAQLDAHLATLEDSQS